MEKDVPLDDVSVSDLSTSEDEPESWESDRKKIQFEKRKLHHQYKKKVLSQKVKKTDL